MGRDLNLGHTLGHAIETVYKIPHGIAVAFGICFDLFISEHDEVFTFFNVLRKFGYSQYIGNFQLENIMDVIKNDKKNKNKDIVFIGLKSYGNPYEIHLNEDDFKRLFNKFIHEMKQW